MSVYVDDAFILFRGKRRCHMTADSLDELHFFAASVGIKPCWYHRGANHPHYDVNEVQRADAVAAGALEVSYREMVVIAKRLRNNKK